MSLVAAAAAGATLGVRHALETDHLAAVATLVDPEADGTPGLVGASWGVGHALPIVALSVAFLALDLRVPGAVVHAVEAVVGLLLVALGARMLHRTVGGDVGLVGHAHPPAGSHRHLRLGGPLFGRHPHLHGNSALVGIVHGVAGSGVLVVALASTASSPSTALGFLAGFVLLSVLTMAGATALWGRSLGAGRARPLQAVAGGVGVVVGIALLAEVCLAVGLL